MSDTNTDDRSTNTEIDDPRHVRVCLRCGEQFVEADTEFGSESNLGYDNATLRHCPNGHTGETHFDIRGFAKATVNIEWTPESQ